MTKASRTNPATDGSEAFFEHWAIYRKIIKFNYMGHDQIAASLAEHLSRRKTISGQEKVGAILDLGCGDAEVPSRYLPGLGAVEYHGVDLAKKPLEFAREKLSGFSGEVHFHLQDQAQFLAGLDRSFDLIIFGFALHHNTLAEKATVVANAARCLNEGGALVVYDVFRQPNETRQAFFGRYLDWIRRDWRQMTAREQMLIDGHIRANDHPDTVADLQACAHRAGLGAGELQLSTCQDFHQLLQFPVPG